MGGFGSLLSPNAGLTSTGGGVTSVAALAGALAGQTSGTFALAHITFTVTGAGSTGTAFYRPGLDGLATISGGFELPPLVGATLATDPIPEPGTLALLGLGVAVLAWSARRCRQPGG